MSFLQKQIILLQYKDDLMFTDLMGNKATQEADKENSSGVYMSM